MLSCPVTERGQVRSHSAVLREKQRQARDCLRRDRDRDCCEQECDDVRVSALRIKPGLPQRPQLQRDASQSRGQRDSEYEQGDHRMAARNDDRLNEMRDEGESDGDRGRPAEKRRPVPVKVPGHRSDHALVQVEAKVPIVRPYEFAYGGHRTGNFLRREDNRSSATLDRSEQIRARIT